ncbi:MAG: PilZ domain-containing protein [Candidatus Omnitrophota bacterium]
MEERRKYPRFELNLTANYKIVDSEEVFKFGQTKNVSADGICFESEEFLKPGTYVELEVDLRDANPSIHIVGEVRWSVPENPRKERYHNGLRVVGMPLTDENRFLKYYCDKMVDKLSEYLKL